MLNEKKIILFINDYLSIVDIDKVDEFINWELLCMLDIWTWFRFILDVYDEKNNSTYYYTAIKVLIYEFVVSSYIICLFFYFFYIIEDIF